MEKPWFKFTANNWLSGSVQLLTDAEKGTYIDIVSMIWKAGGRLNVTPVLSRKLRLDNATAYERIKSYCELDILVREDDVLSISFLDNQLEEFDKKSKQNAENVRKRWDKKDEPIRTNTNKKRKEEKREDKKRIDKTIKETSLPDFIDGRLWSEFLAIRKKLKAVNSERAIKSLIKKLSAIPANANAMIENSIVGSWKDVYPLKNQGKPGQQLKTFSAQAMQDNAGRGYSQVDDEEDNSAEVDLISPV